jgi:deoxyribodipyrimidine photolyase-like uncharacterized protein
MDISTLVIQNKKDRYILEMEYTENDDIKKEIQNIINKLDVPSENKLSKFDNKINEIEELSMKKLFYRLKEPQKINRIKKYFINNHKISEDKAELFSSQIIELLNNFLLKSKDIIYDSTKAEITDIKNIDLIKNNDNVELKLKLKEKEKKKK